MGTRYVQCDLQVDAAEATPTGGLKVPAYISRTGIQFYTTDEGTRAEYRPEGEVFSEDALASFRGASIVVGHPRKRKVDTKTWGRLAVGHLGDDVRRDGDLTAVTVYLDDAQTIERVQARELVELSAGYSTRVAMTPGVTDDGQRYDAVQTEIRGNHVALLPPGGGRAGPEVRLRLDADDNEVVPREEAKMTKDELKTELDQLRSELKADRDASQKETDELRGRCDALESENKTLKTDLAAATDPAAVQARVDARLALLGQARKVKEDVRCDGTDREVMLDVLGDRVDGEPSDDYLRGMFAAHVASAAEKRQTQDEVNQLIVPGSTPRTDALAEAENQYDTRLRSLSQQGRVA